MNAPIRVKKLGHLLYEVTDVERSVRFWTEVMGFTETERNARGLVFLRCNSDHHAIGLVPTAKRARPAGEAGVQMEHLALEVEDLDALFAAREHLRAHGVPIAFEGRHRTGNNAGIEFKDPDGYTFELYCTMDQIPPGGGPRPKAQSRPAESLEEARDNPLPAEW